jgi:hypothetical protein
MTCGCELGSSGWRQDPHAGSSWHDSKPLGSPHAPPQKEILWLAERRSVSRYKLYTAELWTKTSTVPHAQARPSFLLNPLIRLHVKNTHRPLRHGVEAERKHFSINLWSSINTSHRMLALHFLLTFVVLKSSSDFRTNNRTLKLFV